MSNLIAVEKVLIKWDKHAFTGPDYGIGIHCRQMPRAYDVEGDKMNAKYLHYALS